VVEASSLSPNLPLPFFAKEGKRKESFAQSRKKKRTSLKRGREKNGPLDCAKI